MSTYLKWGLALCFIVMISGCATMEEPVASQGLLHSEPSIPLGNVEYHTAVLADELFTNLAVNRQHRYAIATFVPIQSMSYNGKMQSPLMLLGHQLEQGMMTEASRRGLIAQDYKTSNDIIIMDDSETVFSRDIEKLSATQAADFFISGTITEQQEGAIVNARIIHVQSKDVVAAATKFFPAELFWQREKVTSRNGMIYRTGS